MEASANKGFIFRVISILRLLSNKLKGLKQGWVSGKEETDWKTTTNFFDHLDHRDNLVQKNISLLS